MKLNLEAVVAPVPFKFPPVGFIFKKLREKNSLANKGKFLTKEFKFILKFINRKFYKKVEKSNSKFKIPTKPYNGKVILFQASETYGFKDDSHMGWGEIFTGDVKKFIIEGDHLEMMVSPIAAAEMAKNLNHIFIQPI